MSSMRPLVILILVSLLVSAGCGDKGSNKGSNKGTDTEKKETKPAEPKGPGGGEMK